MGGRLDLVLLGLKANDGFSFRSTISKSSVTHDETTQCLMSFIPVWGWDRCLQSRFALRVDGGDTK